MNHAKAIAPNPHHDIALQKIRPLFLALFAAVLAAQVADALADYARPPGKTLRELAQTRGFHVGANFPTLYEKWSEDGKSGPHCFDPEAAIAKDQFTIMTAGWEVFPGHTWLGEGKYDFAGTDKYIEWCRANGIAFHAHGLGYVFRAGWPFQKLPVETEEEIDLLPTFCAAAGVAVPETAKVDGINLLPHLLKGRDISSRGPLFWQLDLYPHMQRHEPKPQPYATEAVMEGRWKLLTRDAKPLELFDLEADVGETHNLLEQHPDIAGKLTGQIRSFLSSPRDRSGIRPLPPKTLPTKK